MPRLVTPYSRMPLLTIAVTTGTEHTSVVGIVDSGADRTLLPKRIANQLGIADSDLIPAAGSGGAGGTHFDTWTAPVALEAQVVGYFPDPRLWGPMIPLDPEFAEETTPLFGRADFFEAFAITFVRDPAQGPVFLLDH